MIEVNLFYIDRAKLPWDYLSMEDGPPARYRVEPDDNEAFAALVRSDLVPWFLEWPPVALDRLRDALEYSFEHDLDVLEDNSWQGWNWMQIHDVLGALWFPLWTALFGVEFVARPKSDYYVVPNSERIDAMDAELDRYRFGDNLPGWLTELAAVEDE